MRVVLKITDQRLVKNSSIHDENKIYFVDINTLESGGEFYDEHEKKKTTKKTMT